MLNENIYMFRRLSGLTRTDMAKALDVSVKKYAGIECGRVDCGEDMLENIAAVLNVKTDDLRAGTISEGFNVNMPDSFFENIGDPELAEYMQKSLSELDDRDRAMLLLIRRIKDKNRAEKALADIIFEEEEF